MSAPRARVRVRVSLCACACAGASSVRAYAEQVSLLFFLYENHMAKKHFAAQYLAQQRGVTADVMMRDSDASTGYWDIVQDACADLTRVMLRRCHDEENHKELYDYCRGLRGQIRLAVFPNLFITIAPAESKFFRPYFSVSYTHLPLTTILLV